MKVPVEDRLVPVEVVKFKLDSEKEIKEKAIHDVAVRYVSSGIFSHLA